MPRPAPTSGAGFDLSYIYLYVLIFFFFVRPVRPFGAREGAIRMSEGDANPRAVFQKYKASSKPSSGQQRSAAEVEAMSSSVRCIFRVKGCGTPPPSGRSWANEGRRRIRRMNTSRARPGRAARRGTTMLPGAFFHDVIVVIRNGSVTLLIDRRTVDESFKINTSECVCWQYKFCNKNSYYIFLQKIYLNSVCCIFIFFFYS